MDGRRPIILCQTKALGAPQNGPVLYPACVSVHKRVPRSKMIVENQQAAPAAAKVYHLRHMYLYAGFFLLLCLGMAGFMLWLPLSMDEPLDTASQVVIGVGAAILAALGIAICVAFLNIRLVAGPAGIAYYSWGYRLRTTWDNVQGTGELWTTRGLIRGL